MKSHLDLSREFIQTLASAKHSRQKLIEDLNQRADLPTLKTDLDEAIVRLKYLEQINNHLQPELNFEQIVHDQYPSQAKMCGEFVARCGAIEKMPPPPFQSEIIAKMKKNKKAYRELLRLGYKKLLIIPFGLSLKNMVGCLSSTLEEIFNDGELRYPDGTMISKLNDPYPVTSRKSIIDPDPTKHLLYFPNKLAKNKHNQVEGKTKPQIIQAWRVVLIKDEPCVVPRRSDQLTALLAENLLNHPEKYAKITASGPHALEYFQLMKKNKLLTPWTPEDAIYYAYYHLVERRQIIDDWDIGEGGYGSTSWLAGTTLPDGQILAFSWDRNKHCYNISTIQPFVRSRNHNFRQAVEIR